MKIRRLELRNFCGYRYLDLDFTDSQTQQINPISVFFAPNGMGKSTALEAIRLLCTPKSFAGRDLNSVGGLLRKYVYNPDYNPTYDEFTSKLRAKPDPMQISGYFETKDGIKEIVINSDLGVIKNELPQNNYENCYFINADSANETHAFQLRSEEKERFLDLAREIYSFDCLLPEIYHPLSGAAYSFITDFIIIKNDGQTKVHYKNMSAGEKKIATLLRSLCDPNYMSKLDLILIDNIEMHIYYKRHPLLIDKLLEVFPNKQFIVTTHSGTLIDHVAKNCNENWLYDLEKIRSNTTIC